jgi:hypothetical protein
MRDIETRGVDEQAASFRTQSSASVIRGYPWRTMPKGGMTQKKTNPAEGKPVDVPVPTRAEVFGDLVAKPHKDDRGKN